MCIKTYGKSELAMKYNPHITASAARRKLNSWIENYPGLRQQLEAIGSAKSRSYTPAQVRLIVEALGEP